MNNVKKFPKKIVLTILLLISLCFVLFGFNTYSTYADEQTSHTVTFKVDGEETTQNYFEGDTINAITPFKKGYRFEGWDKDVPMYMGSENLTFTAIFTLDNIFPTAKIKYIKTKSGSIVATIIEPSEEITFEEDGGVYEFTANGSYDFIITDLAGNKTLITAYAYDVNMTYVSMFAPILIAILSAVVITILLCSYFFLLRPKLQKERAEIEEKERIRLEKEKEEEAKAQLLAKGNEKKQRKKREPTLKKNTTTKKDQE